MDIPPLSRRASVRLPWPRLRRPPYDPGQSVFPSPVLASALHAICQTQVFTAPRRLKRRHAYPFVRPVWPESSSWSAANRSLPALRLGAGRGPRTTECPEPLCRQRELVATGRSPGPPRRTLLLRRRSYGLMRQSHRLSPLSGFPIRRVFAGCCHPLLPMGPSRRYPCSPCRGDWTLTPPCPPDVSAHYSSEGAGLTLR